MRAAHTLLLLALASAPALVLAQNTEAPATNRAAGTVQRDVTSDRDQSGNRHNQRVERIVVEDAGSRVDELRVGGQTKSITVQPKVGTTTPYDISATDPASA